MALVVKALVVKALVVIALALAGLAVPGAALARVPGPAETAETPDPADAGLLLVDGELRTHRATDVILDARGLTFRDASTEARARRVEDCIALARSVIAQADPRPGHGLLLISDGQRLPGVLAADAPAGSGRVAWKHEWLGTISVPLERVSAVLFRPTSGPPASRRNDVVAMLNGDRLEGFVTSVADPIVIEIEIAGEQQEVQVPVKRAAAVVLVTPRRASDERRIWHTDGSVLDVEHLAIGDDGYVRLRTGWVPAQQEPHQVRLENITAVLFDPRRMIPLADLSPSAVEGPPTRYLVPEPRPLDPDAPLGLGRISYRGPLLVRYVLPRGTTRFAAEASLDAAARTWGDLVLVIRADDEEIYRRRLNGEEPRDSINVSVEGSELTIELLPGAHGPVQDHLVLERAMLLIER